jgi:formylglycine-generating enzyme required for sulfatase activity
MRRTGRNQTMGSRGMVSILVTATLGGCSSGGGDAGSVDVTTVALSASDVASVSVTITGDGIPTPIEAALSKSGNRWAGTVGKIPAGVNRTFAAGAYDGAHSLIFQGQASGVTISKNAVAAVLIVLQQSVAPQPFANSAPRIGSVVADASSVEIGGAVGLALAASDPDGDPLTYSWTAETGTFTGGNTSTPTWTPALDTAGTVSITGQVQDGRGGTAAATLTVSVDKGKGSAQISATFNTWPVIQTVTASQGQVAPGTSVELSVTAADSDGDALSYAWNDGGCGGTLSDATSRTPTWTAPGTAPVDGTCTLTVVASDGLGGSTTGRLTINIGAAVTNTPPTVDTAFQSLLEVPLGGTVTLRVTAHDPEGQPVTFAWTASVGTLGTPTTIPAGSEVVWTAPTLTGTFTIRAEASDSLGAKAPTDFPVTVTCGETGGPAMVALPEGYCIDSTEVTRTQYDTWLATGPDTSTQDATTCGWNSTFEPEATCMAESYVCQGDTCGNHPQVCVDWCDAAAYCLAVGKRLCGKIGGGSNDYNDFADATSSQWFGACSDGGSRAYPYGDAYLQTACNGPEYGLGTTVPVGSLTGCRSDKPGYEGVYDLSGNVWEWEDSCSPREAGPAIDACRLRGGSFFPEFNLTCALGGINYVVGNRSTTLGRAGFRCCSN